MQTCTFYFIFYFFVSRKLRHHRPGVSILQRIGAKAEELCNKVWNNKVTSFWTTRRRTQAQNDIIEKQRAAVVRGGARERRRKETSARRWRQVKRTPEVLLRERRKAALEKLERLMTAPPPRVEQMTKHERWTRANSDYWRWPQIEEW